jgi:large subunit ribosomal protein L7/L12
MAAKSYDKLLEEIGSMSLVELADFVKALEEKFGVSAAAPVAVAGVAAPAATQAAAVEEKAEYKVTLEKSGPEKIKTIKALRQVTTLNLSDAKKAVEEAPAVIADAAPKEDAKKIKEALEATGAVVTLA